MARYLLIVAAMVAFGSAAWAGGPPPVYVVVDKVVLEPSADAPERIRIEGSFVRLGSDRNYEYGKPVEGYVYLSLDAAKKAECKAEWAKWQKAAGTGKAVAVGHCGAAGSLLTVTVHKPGEKAERPDATYTPGHLDPEGNWGREDGARDLVAFVKERENARKAAGQAPAPSK